MFRYMNATKLSTKKQKADVLFYPGADASQMMLRAFQDPEFLTIDKRGVKKVIIVVGKLTFILTISVKAMDSFLSIQK